MFQEEVTEMATQEACALTCRFSSEYLSHPVCYVQGILQYSNVCKGGTMFSRVYAAAADS